ncbi:MAG: hypothetical protein K0R57_1217 [Paenibacillaceae bacterium]|jgi:hypothetical protein|nr:hypothetical protein [Paenibacillaceae bacterium]
MNIAVISYSYTGNNDALAAGVANGLSAKHIRITERASRSVGSIALDMIFRRTPRVQPAPEIMERYDLVLFFGPVWMGQIASPLRAYLRYLKAHPRKYGFFSISGGADGPNPKLEDELKKRTGAAPLVFIDLHIAELLPANPKPARKDTTAYRINEGDVKQLTGTVLQAAGEII